MSRRTSTGGVFEESIRLSLLHGGYSVKMQQHVGVRLGGGKHLVDIVAEKSDEKILISLKWQQSSGTAEQKVPYEYICLAETLDRFTAYSRAYLVLGGNGWTKRDFFINGLSSWINTSNSIEVIEGNEFIALANSAKI